MTDRLVTVFGGSGFIGRHTVRALAKRGYRVRVAVRRPDLAFHLQPLGNVGQIHAVQANLRYPTSIAAAVEGADAVVNLVGLLHESGRNSFEAVQAFGAGAVARAARAASATQFIQVSAIGADAASSADYARTKAKGEAAVREAFAEAVTLRPSIVFGPEDDFFNRFAAMARLSPFLPLVGGGETRFQPVFVGDVAEAIARGVDGALKPGATYELGGPEIITRLFVGATFSTCWRSWLITVDRPISSASPPVRARSSRFSRFSFAASIARSMMRSRRSALNGFSMKS